jgi:hypothetical protein
MASMTEVGRGKITAAAAGEGCHCQQKKLTKSILHFWAELREINWIWRLRTEGWLWRFMPCCAIWNMGLVDVIAHRNVTEVGYPCFLILFSKEAITISGSNLTSEPKSSVTLEYGRGNAVHTGNTGIVDGRKGSAKKPVSGGGL